MGSEVEQSGALVEHGGCNSAIKLQRFSGKYSLCVDDKSRVVIVAAFRGGLSGRAILRKNRRQKCVEVLPLAVWEAFLGKLAALSALDEDVQRLVTLESASAVEVSVDKQGRMLLPAEMRSFAGIDGSEVVMTGANDRLKVWEPSVWNEFEKQAAMEDLEARVFAKYGL